MKNQRTKLKSKFYFCRYELKRLEIHNLLRGAIIQSDCTALKTIIQNQVFDLEYIINMAPNGVNTLLFLSCESGQKEIVKILLENGANGAIHPVTKYCPLYISCYSGKLDIIELLLRRFPKQVQSLTVEKWLPIHAAAINGQLAAIDLLLRFDYPSYLYQR